MRHLVSIGTPRHAGDPATACSRRCEFSTYGLVVPALHDFGGYVVASGCGRDTLGTAGSAPLGFGGAPLRLAEREARNPPSGRASLWASAELRCASPSERLGTRPPGEQVSLAADLRTVLSIGRPSMYDGHCVREGGADAELTRNPDGSPLALDECLGDVEAESGPLDLGFDPRLDT
jgi:hypothetical protein